MSIAVHIAARSLGLNLHIVQSEVVAWAIVTHILVIEPFQIVSDIGIQFKSEGLPIVVTGSVTEYRRAVRHKHALIIVGVSDTLAPGFELKRQDGWFSNSDSGAQRRRTAMHTRIARLGIKPSTCVQHYPWIVALFKVDVTSRRIQGFVKRVHAHDVVEILPPLGNLIVREWRNRGI